MTGSPNHRVRALAQIADRLAAMDKNEASRRLHAELNRLRQGVEALEGVRTSRNPIETEAAHTKRVATLARRLDKDAVAAMNRAGQIIREGVNALQRRIDERVNLKPDAFAREIRARFCTMSRKDQVKLLGDLVKENRGPELAAIVKAPAILTGLSDSEHARYEQAILGMHAPNEMAELTELNEAFETSMLAAGLAGKYAEALSAPDKIAAIEQGEAAAIAAEASFNQAVQ